MGQLPQISDLLRNEKMSDDAVLDVLNPDSHSRNRDHLLDVQGAYDTSTPYARCLAPVQASWRYESPVRIVCQQLCCFFHCNYDYAMF